MTTLIIVESPTKSKAIKSYAGAGYTVKASFGHCRDLPKKELGVDVERGFAVAYRITNLKVVHELQAAAESADSVILCTDPDREGEAIAWHLAEVLRKQTRGKPVLRAAFHEITPAAVKAALAAPRPIDLDLVNAQQARRVLDRLVGYKVSPLLWKQIKRPWVGGKKPPALSAGRVQSVALRLVVERDREIDVFIPVEFWTLDAELEEIRAAGAGTAGKPARFKARLVQVGTKSVGAPAEGKQSEEKEPAGKESAARESTAKESGLQQAQVQAIIDDLQGASWRVGSVQQKQERRYPYPPFTTSTLQQAGSARMGWNPKKTMKVAQELFEGVSIGGTPTASAAEDGPHKKSSMLVGLITYMRTDSLTVAPEAQQAARDSIQKYWPQALPDQPPHYKTKVANAQEAHEAIRPTDPARTPKSIRDSLTPDQAALYEIIWRRFIASQMKPAVYSVTTVDFPHTGKSGQRYLFRAIGRLLIDPGFLAVYAVDEDDQSQESSLPNLRANDLLNFIRFLPEKHMTEPPRRYSQASLIRELEKRGLGRPSTYASIVETLLERAYVTSQRGRGKALQSTPVGCQVLDYLMAHFADVFDYSFTARMEEQLDEIARGTTRWQGVLGEFWKTLGPRVGG